jgi:uncharacterized protein YndB with AHSA1/START domain
MKVGVERDIAGHRMNRVAPRVDVRIDRVPAPGAADPSERVPYDGQRVHTIHVRDRYDAPPRRIFDAWLDPTAAGRWLFATASVPMTDVCIDARVGGSFRCADRQGATTFAFAGRYVEIVPHRRLVFTLSTPRQPVASLVTVTIAPHGTGGALDLVHEHLSSDEARYLEDRWSGILYGLGVMLDSLTHRSTITGSPL